MSLTKILSWTAVVLWVALIFYLSHQPAHQSNRVSTGITEIIVKTVEKIVPGAEFNVKSFNHLVRKNAHFFVYLILGVLVMNALARSGVYGCRGVGLALLICVLCAVSDEIHQLFVPGRGGQVKDVLIDSAGAGIGIWLGRFF
jgi:VanZ family protein